MKSMFLAALIAAFAAPACAHAAPPGQTRIVLTFEPGAETGAVLVSLYDSEAGYAGGAPMRQARVDIAAGERTATFDGLPAGDYAARAFHDVNGDGRMTLNPFGIPIEPFAFSNNAVGRMGPAPWSAARFAAAGETSQTIVIR